VRKYYSPLGAGKLVFIKVIGRKAEDKNYSSKIGSQLSTI
jgi:hypothetical protein